MLQSTKWSVNSTFLLGTSRFFLLHSSFFRVTSPFFRGNSPASWVPLAPSGHDVANLVKDTLPRLLAARLTEAADLREMFTAAGHEMTPGWAWGLRTMVIIKDLILMIGNH